MRSRLALIRLEQRESQKKKKTCRKRARLDVQSAVKWNSTFLANIDFSQWFCIDWYDVAELADISEKENFVDTSRPPPSRLPETVINLTLEANKKKKKRSNGLICARQHIADLRVHE
jgi:hypothetical protein